MNTSRFSLFIVLAFVFFSCSPVKVLIIDGQNNHDVWPKSTVMMKQYLEEAKGFKVDVSRSQFTWKAGKQADYLPLAGVGATQDIEQPKPDPDFAPDFEKYDVVISNFGWKAAAWPTPTQLAFEEFVSAGGGFVSIHAADNSFPEWKAYNEMIGLGGWGGRTEKDGPYVYYNNEGTLIRDEAKGSAGSHGPRHEFPVTIRIPDHPITRGMPAVWLTTVDECYAQLRGPAKNLTILATGKDHSDKPPTDRHEPVLMTVTYGNGRIFHSTLGHSDVSMEGVGFIESFLRGVEWAATGKVTRDIPADFPAENVASSRSFQVKNK